MTGLVHRRGVAPSTGPGPPLLAGVDAGVLAVFAGATAALMGLLAWNAPPDRLALFALGIALGVSLCHAAFGFTGGWRRAIEETRTLGLRAQLLLLAVTATLFLPLLSADTGVHGALAPLGVNILVGAFLFGAGMQLGGGCGSGTLFLAGSGKLRMLIVLAAFIAGSLLGSLHVPWWLERPSLAPVSLTAELGWLPALLVQLAVLGGMAIVLTRLERRRHGEVQALLRPRLNKGWTETLMTGQWPFLWGALTIAALAAAVLWVSGSPWGITFGFTLWGAEALMAAGVDLARFEYWQWPYPRQGLSAGVLGHASSVTNLGILLGAFLAAGLAGRFRANAAQRPGPAAIASGIGAGLAMGYGARLAFGCNIGAMLGGIASASVHGWVWFAAAFLGFWSTASVRRRLGR